MKPFFYLLFFSIILVLNQSCNTLYSTRVIDIEIIEPGKVTIPSNYKTVAFRYNNCNVAPNPYYKNSYVDDTVIFDTCNIDSLASEVYFQYFLDEIRQQDFFDSVIKIEAQDYSTIQIIDTITHMFSAGSDTTLLNKELSQALNVYLFSNTINAFPNTNKKCTSEKFLHHRLGLYQPSELQEIADTTEADLLISLDYFASLDWISYNRMKLNAKEVVKVQAYWNFYDLKEQEYFYSKHKRDTIIWNEYVDFPKDLEHALPPRKDAVLNAADIAGVKFANFLIPHWTQVQRMYYKSGHIELKKTNDLIKEGKWLEAAKIWKANTNNPNKAIEAKSKFNMALVCEMQGNINAALEWVVQSFHVFGQKNQEHYINCKQYIAILSQRKQDLQILDHQFQPTSQL